MISLLALTVFPLLQNPSEKPDRLKPLVPAPENFQPKPVTNPTPTGAANQPQSTAGNLSVRPVQPSPEAQGSGPRPNNSTQVLPFQNDRPVLVVDGVEISTAELNELVAYYRTYRSGSDDLLLQDAVKALLPLKVVQAHYADQLPSMRTRIQEAHAAATSGRDFAQVVREFSSDSEAPTDDGRYTFGRSVAVQPFDRLSHSTAIGAFSSPFLTVYGYHFLEVLDYERGGKPQDDQSTMRHVLVMYPEMIAMEKRDEDVRVWIKKQVKASKIEVLEVGARNLVPPENRGQIVGD